ncbi:FliH/SctL family protein [Baekduia sp. Peel2402]|uniref:FliH/SctL family protein n=1 Tax=Baekduia sp. Peel2402 TaxID=3458296 RepID=UPI00403E5F97
MQDFAFPTLEALDAPTFNAPEAVDQAPPIDIEAEAEAARAAGHEAGFQAGLIEAQAHMAAGVAALQAAAAAVDAERTRLATAVEPAAVELALKIAEQALAASVAVRPEAVVEVVRGALRRLAERERVTILVNPEDLELVRTASETLAAELGGIEHCDVQAERRVGRGGAIVRTVEGEVDATLATKLSKAREVLEDELRGEGDGAEAGLA